MADQEEKDVNTVPGGVEEPAADATDQQAVSQPDTGEVVVQPDTGAEDKTIPYDRFKEVNEAKNVAEAQLQAVQNQNLLLQRQAMAQPAQATQPESTYARALRESGLDSQSFITEEERAGVFLRKEQLDAQAFQQQQVVANNQQFAATHNDYGDVVGTTDPLTGGLIPSKEFQALLIKKPYLIAAIGSNAQMAYESVIEARELAEFERTKTVMAERDTRQKVAAKTDPMSPTVTGGGGSADKQFSTAEDVRAMEAQIARGEFEKR